MTGSAPIVIDGPLWFLAALVLCGGHTLFLLGWRREHRAHRAWLAKYDADASARHDAFMRHNSPAAGGWDLKSPREKGQA